MYCMSLNFTNPQKHFCKCPWSSLSTNMIKLLTSAFLQKDLSQERYSGYNVPAYHHGAMLADDIGSHLYPCSCLNITALFCFQEVNPLSLYASTQCTRVQQVQSFLAWAWPQGGILRCFALPLYSSLVSTRRTSTFGIGLVVLCSTPLVGAGFWVRPPEHAVT